MYREWRNWDERDLDEGPRLARPSPGKVSLTSRLKGPVQRKEAGGRDVLESARARQVLSDSAASSAGRPVDVDVRQMMESSFGRSFGNVNIHTDGSANKAAADLNARAFTVGSDIFFGASQYAPNTESGKRLLGHEFAHVAQNQGVSPTGGEGTRVSGPGEANEAAADRAADAVVSGNRVGDVGTGAPNTIHRDMMSDLDENSRRNNVDENAALKTIASMSHAEQAKIPKDHGLMKRLCAAFNDVEMLELYSHIWPWLDLRWKIYWLDIANELKDLSAKQWAWIMGHSTPDQFEGLRGYKHGFKQFLKYAPDMYITPWDKLEGLANGDWKGNAQKIRDCCVQLNPTQRTKVANDEKKMEIIMKRCGNAKEKVRTVMYLDPPLRWKIYWLIVGKAVDNLTRNDWSQILTEASASEYDALVKYPAGWAATEKHCPSEIIQITRQNRTAAVANAAFTDPVQVKALFNSLGPVGFLAAATKGNNNEVLANYLAAKDLIGDVLDGLPRGPRMGKRTRDNLAKWFYHGQESRISIMEKMVGVRFSVNTEATAKANKKHFEKDKNGNVTVDIKQWTVSALRKCWVVMERLPPAQVVNNNHLIALLRNDKESVGNAYAWNRDVVMGIKNDNELTGNVGASQTIYSAGGRDRPAEGVTGTPAIAMNEFNATLRHEIGHAVDNQLGIMKKWKHQTVAGGWKEFGSASSFADAIIVAGKLFSHNYPEPQKYMRAIRKAVVDETDFEVALAKLGGDVAKARPFKNKGPIAAVWKKHRWFADDSPWYKQSWKPQGGRNFHKAYKNRWYSFDAQAQKGRTVTKYRWRAPGEWFAESYQVYYAEQEQNPNVPVGGILRSKDADAADMLSSLVDRGFSPQDRLGKGVTKSPGA